MQNVMPLRRKRDHDEPTVMLEPTATFEPERTQDNGRRAPAPVIEDTSAPAVMPQPQLARLDAVELGSLVSLALRCALVATTVAALGATLLWIVATAAGVVQRTESFMESIGFRDFHISPVQVIAGTVLLVGGVTLVLATGAVVMGAAYNVFALRGHGLRVRMSVIAGTGEAAPEEALESASSRSGIDRAASSGDPAA